MSLPLSGFRIGVTAARKAEEQVTLLERRGATVEWAAALSLEPNRVDLGELLAATKEVILGPVDLFLATTGIGMKTWLSAATDAGLYDDLVAALGSAEILARGIVGTRGDVPVVASPMHKQAYDLRTGQCLDDAAVRVPTYDVRVDDGLVLVGSLVRPPQESP